LAGIVVVDLTRALAGPHATMMFGDLGARVIKVEAPGGGDDSRGWGPPFVYPHEDAAQRTLRIFTGAPNEGRPDGGERQSTYFLSTNRDKESIVLDLKSAESLATLTDLLGRADVLCENFRSGVMPRLGLSDERLLEINPRLVVLSISGFGHDGPEGGRPGYDQIAQGEAGLMSLTGSGPDDPQKTGVPVGDLIAGMWGAYGVLAALLERERTGRGQIVRTSLLAGLVGVHAYQGTRWTIATEVPRAQGNHHPSISPYGLFHCRDGAVQLACGSEGLWRRLCAEFGLDPDAEGMATNADRVGHRDDLIALLEVTFADLDGAELLARLDAAGVPSGRVRTLDDVYDWEQTRSQGLALEVAHPTLGTITLPGSPLRFFAASEHGVVETTRVEHAPPPLLDEHAAAIREWLDG
jgi:crotonobetainyl-CoA:carnitine CoA-transferase CaiB-like acyl-CoA transferase